MQMVNTIVEEKFHSPKFFVLLAQTNRLLERNNEHNNTVTHHFFLHRFVFYWLYPCVPGIIYRFSHR